VATNMIIRVAPFSGMLALLAWLTIGRWMSWPPFIPFCTPIEGEDKLCWTPSCKEKFDVRSFYPVVQRQSLVPLKEYLVDQGSLESAFLHLVSGSREDFNH
jgi:hypothetical protein